jgi:hypothetical protein
VKGGCRLQIAECGMLNADFKPQITSDLKSEIRIQQSAIGKSAFGRAS